MYIFMESMRLCIEKYIKYYVYKKLFIFEYR